MTLIASDFEKLSDVTLRLIVIRHEPKLSDVNMKRQCMTKYLINNQHMIDYCRYAKRAKLGILASTFQEFPIYIDEWFLYLILRYGFNPSIMNDRFVVLTIEDEISVLSQYRPYEEILDLINPQYYDLAFNAALKGGNSSVYNTIMSMDVEIGWRHFNNIIKYNQIDLFKICCDLYNHEESHYTKLFKSELMQYFLCACEYKSTEIIDYLIQNYQEYINWQRFVQDCGRQYPEVVSIIIDFYAKEGMIKELEYYMHLPMEFFQKCLRKKCCSPKILINEAIKHYRDDILSLLSNDIINVIRSNTEVTYEMNANDILVTAVAMKSNDFAIKLLKSRVQIDDYIILKLINSNTSIEVIKTCYWYLLKEQGFTDKSLANFLLDNSMKKRRESMCQPRDGKYWTYSPTDTDFWYLENWCLAIKFLMPSEGDRIVLASKFLECSMHSTELIDFFLREGAVFPYDVIKKLNCIDTLTHIYNSVRYRRDIFAGVVEHHFNLCNFSIVDKLVSNGHQ